MTDQDDPGTVTAEDQARFDAALAEHGLSPDGDLIPAQVQQQTEPLTEPAQATPDQDSPQPSDSDSGPPAQALDPALLEKALRVAPMEGLPESVIRGMDEEELQAWHARYVERETKTYREKAELAEAQRELSSRQAAAPTDSTEPDDADLGLPGAVSEELSEDGAKALKVWGENLVKAAVREAAQASDRANGAARGETLVGDEFDRLKASGGIPLDLPGDARQVATMRAQELAKVDGPWQRETDTAKAVTAVVQAALHEQYPTQLLSFAANKLMESKAARVNGASNPGRRAVPGTREMDPEELQDRMAAYIAETGETDHRKVRKHFGLKPMW